MINSNRHLVRLEIAQEVAQEIAQLYKNTRFRSEKDLLDDDFYKKAHQLSKHLQQQDSSNLGEFSK